MSLRRLFIVVAAWVTLNTQAFAGMQILRSNLSLTFHLAAHRLEGEAKLDVKYTGGTAGFFLGDNFSVDSAFIGDQSLHLVPQIVTSEEISSDYGKFGRWTADDAQYFTFDWRKTIPEGSNAELLIKWSGELYAPLDDREFSRERIAFEVAGTIGEEGIYLSPSAWWYPRLPDQPAAFSVSAKLPVGWTFVTAGRPISEVHTDDYWQQAYTCEQPVDGIHLSAGPYVVEMEEYKETFIATYFLPNQADLASGYLEACRGYLDLYETLIAPYPFPRFVVVDNFLPSGYGMPGWTLLGSEVLRLPFIKATSLGHEVLHNWWGNSLWVDYREGNWCEGLTSYMADYLYKERTSPAEAREYRMNVLRDFQAYVTPENDYPISLFMERSDAHDRAIGYGKVMMIFHMLRRQCDRVSDSLFFQTLSRVYREYQWQAVGWNDWQNAFEQALDKELDDFFNKWVSRTGVPEIRLDATFTIQDENTIPAVAQISAKWNGEHYNGEISARMTDRNGAIFDSLLVIKNGKCAVEISHLTKIELDPDFHLMRKIYPGEMPLTLAAFFGDPNGLLVIPSTGKSVDQWQKAAEGLKGELQRVIMDTALTAEDASSSLWLMGGQDNLQWEKFAPVTSISADFIAIGADTARGHSVSLTVINNHPTIAGATLVTTAGMPDADPVAGTRKLPHYGKYSAVGFDGDLNVFKSIHPPSGRGPWVWNL